MEKRNNFSALVGFVTLYKKECQRFLKVVGQTVLSPLISMSLYLLIFGINLADSITNQNGVNYLQFIIPGLIAMGALNNSFQNSSSSVIVSKFHGDLQDLKVVPLQPIQIIWAYALGATTRGFMVAAAITIVGQIFYFVKYGTILIISQLFLLFAFMLLGCLTFAFLGFGIALFAKNFDQISAIGTFVILPLIYLGGVFFSIERLHPFWKAISFCNPLFYLVNGIRYAFLGVSDIQPQVAFFASLGFVAITYCIGTIAVMKGSYTRF